MGMRCSDDRPHLRLHDPAADSPGALGLEAYVRSHYLRGHLSLAKASGEQLLVAARLCAAHHGGRFSPNELTVEAVTEWLCAYAEGKSANTVNSKRTQILAIWRHAAQKKHSPPAPDPKSIPRAKALKRKPQAWTMDQLSALLAVARKLKGTLVRRKLLVHKQRVETPAALWWEALILLCYDTGLRIGAVMKLRTDDFDLNARTLLAPAEIQKDGEDLEQAISVETLAALEKIWPTKPGIVFTWPCHRRWLFARMRQLVTLAKIPSPRGNHLFHRIRRTSASHAKKAMGEAAAQKHMGHATPKMLERYIDDSIAEPEKPRVADKLPRPKRKTSQLDLDLPSDP